MHSLVSRSLLCVLAGAIAWSCTAWADVWQPPAGHTQVPIWPGAVPDAVADAQPESTGLVQKPVAGRPWTYVVDVSQPTMTFYPPKSGNTGAAMVVFPGGGYEALAIDLEGTEVCDWLVTKGIACVVLKYRVPASGPHWDDKCQCHKDAKAPMALEDAQRTLGLVRLHAKEWGIDPRKIGVIGFSAGGHLVADISTHWQKRAYRPVDAADAESCRPDFAIALYPGHLREHTTKEFELNPTIPVSDKVPPTLLVQAVDDPVDDVENSLVYYIALKKAGVPVELHLFAQGGHAFGLRPTKLPITHWPQLAETWLEAIGVTSKGDVQAPQ
jgi:acetyl esterase/lipase